MSATGVDDKAACVKRVAVKTTSRAPFKLARESEGGRLLGGAPAPRGPLATRSARRIGSASRPRRAAGAGGGGAAGPPLGIPRQRGPIPRSARQSDRRADAPRRE